MDVRDLIRMVRAGWSPGEINLIVADPPCTPWSRAGNRKGLDDERDMLRATAELIGLLRPRCYLIGNVPGLQDATKWHVVQDIIGGLSRFGYCTNDYLQLDAADYGVPQHRIRPFWFGHLDGNCWRPPLPTHCNPDELATIAIPGTGLLPWVTCRQALRHLPPEELGRPVRQKWNKKHPSSLKASRVGAGAAHVLEWPWERPSTTVHEDPRLAPPGHHTDSDRSHPNAIVLSEKAAAILQGFPEDWVFSGKTKKTRWAQIGMAMPPALAEAVARSIIKQMEPK